METMKSIALHIAEKTGEDCQLEKLTPLSGGCINDAWLLESRVNRYFVKTNQSGMKSMFEAEALGLQDLASSQTIKVPTVICYGDDGQQSYLVLEFLKIKGTANPVLLGEQLAQMHKVESERFGWRQDNTIGLTAQLNKWNEDWLVFWRDLRLGFQLELAAKNGFGGELQSEGEKLMMNMATLFENRQVKPSMLHGDLWGGNVAGLTEGAPVIFDPAFYYGDREADLAMTYVFGGFDADFYQSYQNAYPLDDGFDIRKTFYNIYHIINHMNLFGDGYQTQAIQMLKRVNAEI